MSKTKRAKVVRKRKYVKDPGGYTGEAMQSLGMIRPPQRKKRAKVVRAWAIVSKRGTIRLLKHRAKGYFSPTYFNCTHPREAPHVLVPLTGTLPHKKGAKKSKLAQQEKAQ